MKDIPRYWKPLRPAVALPADETLIADYMRLCDLTREQALTAIDADADCKIWRNDLYQVMVRPMGKCFVHLNIRRIDGAAAIRDWRHFQQIKNELVGEECEAFELYPAESRKVDTSNKYHLFACTDPTFRFPFGEVFGNRRDVSYESGNAPGTRQRAI